MATDNQSSFVCCAIIFITVMGTSMILFPLYVESTRGPSGVSLVQDEIWRMSYNVSKLESELLKIALQIKEERNMHQDERRDLFHSFDTIKTMLEEKKVKLEAMTSILNKPETYAYKVNVQELSKWVNSDKIESTHMDPCYSQFIFV
jgi:hypothetical protein